MAVNRAIKSCKLTLKLAEGSQTINGCNPSATDEQLYQLANAVSSLNAQFTDTVTKTVEHYLIVE